ncbi:MAG: ATP-binding cassette domain-containing protein [Selenomonas montiformis]|nr:ATP-binding cassette domain-containing protein [Selenomonas montiformis]
MELSVQIRKKLRDFELDVAFETGSEVFALLGASGCGKSMTLRCIAGIETPDCGRIVLNGRTLYDSAQGICLKPQQRRVGYLFQNYALFPNMTVAENIRFAASGSREEQEKKVKENLVRFSLEELKDAYPAELSGGQQQRVAFARILVSSAELLLLDEPFSALDGYMKWQLEMELSEVLKSYDGTALLVSHDRGEVFRLADKAAVIHRGKMEPVHTKHGLFRQPDTLAATILTGCKNITQARRLDMHHIYAADWNMVLETEQEVPANVRYAGVRAHFLHRSREMEPNVFPMDVIRVIEDTFSYLIMVRRKGMQGRMICWEVPKEEWEPSVSAELFLRFPADEIMLMER